MTEWGTGKTRFEQLVALGIRPTRIPQHTVEDGINGVRANFSDFEFDELACSDGLKALRSYRKEWDDERGRWKDKPDALRYVVMAHRPGMRTKLDADGKLVDPLEPVRKIKVLMPMGPDQVGVTLDEIFEDNERGRRINDRI